MTKAGELRGKISRFTPGEQGVPTPSGAKASHLSANSSVKKMAKGPANPFDSSDRLAPQKNKMLERLDTLTRVLNRLHKESNRAKSNYSPAREDSASNLSVMSSRAESKTKIAKRHLKDTSRKVVEDHKILERQDLLMTQLSICQDQIEKEIKRVTEPLRSMSGAAEKISIRRLACMNCSASPNRPHHAGCETDKDPDLRDLSLNSLLEDEGLKGNEVCSNMRAYIKKQAEILKAEDLRLIGDDTTLIRMINFFNEYKKRYEEWKRRQEKKDKMLRKNYKSKDGTDSNNGHGDENEESRREKNLKTRKLKPFYYPSLTEEGSDDELARREMSLQHSLNNSRMSKEPNVIKDRSIKGNDKYYEPEVPENVLYVEDASIGEPSIAGSKYYLTEGEGSVAGKKKVTLNLRIPKSKLQHLKNIRALIRTRDPSTNALVTKEKTFNLDYVAETVSTTDKHNKKYHFKNIGDQSIKNSLHDRSTELTSNLPSIGLGNSTNKAPISIEKVQFGKKYQPYQPLPELKNSSGKHRLIVAVSKDLNNGTLDKRKGMFFLFIGDPKNEFDFDNIKHFDNYADYNADSEIHLSKLEFLHSETAIYSIEIKYKVGTGAETNFVEHRMMGDSAINKTKLTRSTLNLYNSERVIACSGVFSRQMHCLLFTTNYAKTYQVNDFHREYEQSFETRYDFETGEGLAFMNAGFLSSLEVTLESSGEMAYLKIYLHNLSVN